uniref:Uncharacterized protein n=1 Tax=Candidatus Kentrum sp. FW TaxID=2126338 RepID=A0A450TFA9_9GAMM|nr:MAG: hypothetical protein BECKFW1821B_GA0114236_11082 [Candidatus Kentron sp. FW]
MNRNWRRLTDPDLFRYNSEHRYGMLAFAIAKAIVRSRFVCGSENAYSAGTGSIDMVYTWVDMNRTVSRMLS